jgi:large subunit ribosomal protein L5
MDICIITSAKNDTEGLKLLSLMGMPFREPGGGRSSASAAKKKTQVTFRASQGESRLPPFLHSYR